MSLLSLFAKQYRPQLCEFNSFYFLDCSEDLDVPLNAERWLNLSKYETVTLYLCNIQNVCFSFEFEQLNIHILIRPLYHSFICGHREIKQLQVWLPTNTAVINEPFLFVGKWSHAPIFKGATVTTIPSLRYMIVRQ